MGKSESIQLEKHKVLKEYKLKYPETYERLMLLDKLLEYDNLIDHRMTQNFIYWRDPIAFNKLMRSLGNDNLMGIIKTPEKALKELERKETEFGKSSHQKDTELSYIDSELLEHISDYTDKLKSYTIYVYRWLYA